jgi:hypothetical protein
MITLDKVKQIEAVINKYMNVMNYVLTGENKPDESVLESLRIKDKKPIVDLFYKYGKAEMLSNISIKNKNAEEIFKLISNVELSDADKKALLFIKINSLNSIDSFKNDIKKQVINEVTKNDIKNIFIKNVDANDSTTIAKKLEDLTKDYTKNWRSIAHTELWNAKIYGQAESIIEHSKDGLDTIVYKKLEPDACKHCKKHYLDSNGNPKKFTLRELIENGTNYGKKVGEWKPVLGTMHPNCMCRLVVASTEEVSPPSDLSKSVPVSTRKVDKTKLRYEKKMVNDHGILHEQGFWVKDDQGPSDSDSNAASNPSDEHAKVKDANAKKYEGDPKSPNQKAVGPGKASSNSNISGMNQHTGANVTQDTEPQTIQVTQGDKDVELPTIPLANLPDKRKKYFGAILGFDYGTALSLKYIFGREKALKYLQDTGFKVDVSDSEQAWNKAWNEIEQYLCVSSTPNSNKDYQEKIFNTIQSSASHHEEGDYARLINTVTGGMYPTLGVYDYNKDKVLGIVTQVGNTFYGNKGKYTLSDIYSKWLHTANIASAIPLVPLDLKLDPKNSSRGDWFFNEIRLQSANVRDKDAKEILKKLVRELTGQKPALE